MEIGKHARTLETRIATQIEHSLPCSSATRMAEFTKTSPLAAPPREAASRE